MGGRVVIKSFPFNQEENLYRHSRNRYLQKAASAFCECGDILTERLNGEDRKLLDKLLDAVSEMTANSDVKNFIDGTKIGAKLMLEILGSDT